MHETAEEAIERTLLMHKVYTDFFKETLAIPVVGGKKTESEKFAGAESTYTIEAMMHNGYALRAVLPTISETALQRALTSPTQAETTSSTIHTRHLGVLPQE